MTSLTLRTSNLELIDLGTYSDREYEQCLKQLKLINFLTNGYTPTLQAIKRLAKLHPKNKPLRIFDIGYGYGDTLRQVAKWAHKNKIAVELSGIDLNPLSRYYAHNATPYELKIKYLIGDVFLHAPDEPYDICMNALMMHHLDDQQITKLLQWMNKYSKLGFFINDLHRNPIAYIFIKYFTQLFGFNRLITNDAPLSVARSFKRNEWGQYFKNAKLNLNQLKVIWHWAFRYGVLYEKF